jgi:hypothetical protein
MSAALIFRLVLAAGVLLTGWWLYRAAPKMDIPTLFAVFLLGGLVIAIWLTHWLLPKLGDAVATFFFSSGEKITSSPALRAAAKVAQGDYEGAISEHEKILADSPQDVMAISEIAKLKADKLNDPTEAIRFLREYRNRVGWSAEDEAFLSFRLVDVLAANADHAEAEEVLKVVMEKHAGTRHAANAKHRLNELRSESGASSSQARK